MKSKNNKAYIVTKNGEFLNVKYKGKAPEIGTEYTGTLINRNNSLFKYRHAAAAVLLMVLLSASGVYAYYVPVSTITVSSNPEVQIKSNIFKRVLEASSPDENTNKLIKSMNLKNTNIDKAAADVKEEIQTKSKEKENVNNNQGNDPIQNDVKGNKENAPGTSISNENKNLDNTVKDSNQNKNDNSQKWKTEKETTTPENKQNNPNKR